MGHARIEWAAALVAATTLVSAASCPGRAQAAWPQVVDAPVPPRHVRSARRWAVQLSGGLVRPRFDGREAHLRPPASRRVRFEPEGPRPLVRLAADHVLPVPAGVLVLSACIGYARVSGMAAADAWSVDAGAPRSAALTAGRGVHAAAPAQQPGAADLSLVPLSGSLGYRFTGLADRGTSLAVPYLRAGLEQVLWHLEVPSGSGRGEQWHAFATVGMALRLDALDPHSARHLDLDAGINHTSVFVEVTRQRPLRGDAAALDLGRTRWDAGLRFAF